MGLRDPVVVMLLVAAVFDGISDNWVHALFLGTVGMALAWDAHRRRRQHLIDEVAGADSDLDRGAAVLDEVADGGPTATGAGGALSLTHDGALALDASSARSYAHAASSRYWAAVYSAAGIAFAVIVGGGARNHSCDTRPPRHGRLDGGVRGRRPVGVGRPSATAQFDHRFGHPSDYQRAH